MVRITRSKPGKFSLFARKNGRPSLVENLSVSGFDAGCELVKKLVKNCEVEVLCRIRSLGKFMHEKDLICDFLFKERKVACFPF